MDFPNFLIALGAYATAFLVFYGYYSGNKYLDVLIAGFSVSFLATTLLLGALGIAAGVGQFFFQIAVVLGIAAVILLIRRLLVNAYRYLKNIADKWERK